MLWKPELPRKWTYSTFPPPRDANCSSVFTVPDTRYMFIYVYAQSLAVYAYIYIYTIYIYVYVCMYIIYIYI